ncbi:MAG: RHS repeat-associated core domain-containing protein, partial [Kiritimatiellia bacterium]
MTTYRNEASGAGDTTTWAYDEASGVLLSKTYADGKGLTYTYTDDGNLVTRTARNTRVTNRDIISENPFRFSSEAHDDALALVYYNYRHYNPADGRWCTRDLIEESVSFNLFLFCKNSNNVLFDKLGLDYFDCLGKCIQQNDPLDIVVDSFINQVL